MSKSLAIFESFKIRRHYDEEKELWYFSVIDIVAALTDQKEYQVARKYWNKLKERLKSEGSQLVTNCHQLKMKAQDGKMRMTDVADVKTILRLVQSVPSKKGGKIAKDARKALEEKSGKSVITGDSFLPKNKEIS
jgi:hypothetical protein